MEEDSWHWPQASTSTHMHSDAHVSSYTCKYTHKHAMHTEMENEFKNTSFMSIQERLCSFLLGIWALGGWESFLWPSPTFHTHVSEKLKGMRRCQELLSSVCS